MIRVFALVLALAAPAWAVEPDEMLADPVLESRAQALDEVLRCVQCRSENIASSNADWARDARVLVRDLISAGASDDDVMNFFVERYGEVVLMQPRATGANLILWFAAPVMLVVAGGVSLAFLRRRSGASPQPDALSAEDQARLDEILKK